MGDFRRERRPQQGTGLRRDPSQESSPASQLPSAGAPGPPEKLRKAQAVCPDSSPHQAPQLCSGLLGTSLPILPPATPFGQTQDILFQVWLRDSTLHPGHGVPLSHRLRTACAPPRAGSLAVAASQNGDIAPLPPAAGLLEWKILPAEKQAKKRKQNITISGDW